MPDDPILDGEPIIIKGKRGAVYVESSGNRPVIYTGEESDGPGAEVDSVTAAFGQLMQDKPGQPVDAPMDEAYAKRALDHEEAVLEAQLERQIEEDRQIAETMSKLSAGAADVAKGVFLEGGQAVLTGAKNAVNETLDLVDEVADRLPGAAVVWGDTDANPETNNGVRLEFGTGTEIKKKTGLGSLLPRLNINPKDKPETTTGKVIEGISQFATGMVGGSKVLKGWTAATRAGQIGKAMASGAIADFAAFDGHQQRLSDLLAQVAPEKAKPIFEYLASDAEDPEIVGRLKNAVEGLGLGLAAEGVVSSVRAIRAARVVKAAARKQAKAEGLQVDPVAQAAVLAEQAKAAEATINAALGHPRGPTFYAKAKRSAGTTAKDVLNATAEPNEFNINFGRINTPEDVKDVISTIARRHAGDVEGARRGMRTWNETQIAAGKLDWVASMAERKTGDAVNAETALAYRQALNSSATKLLELAREVQANPSVANQYAFRKMLGVHRAIQLEYMGARAEAGRSLNAFKIAAGTPERSLRQIDNILAESGGANATRDLARSVVDAAERGDVALNELVRYGAMARSRDLIRLVRVNALLSGLGTPAINIAGNTSAALMNLAARAVSPRLARAAGDMPATEIGEASAIVHGYMAALRDVFRLNPMKAAELVTADGAAALREQGIWRGLAPGLDGAAPKGITLRSEREEAGAIGDAAARRPLSAAAWGQNEASPLGRFLDVAQMIVESPSNFNALADDFFKVAAARGELHAQAFRQVMREVREGADAGADAIKARLQEIVDNPTDAMLDAAEREMHELTFSRSDGKVAKAFEELRRVMDSAGPVPLGTVLMPFIRTPANVISTSMRYTPLAGLMARVRKDLAEGGARAEVAKAQMAIGTAFWSVWLGMAMDGKLTGRGPNNKAQREALMRSDEFGGAMWQPYSIETDDRWISFERLDPPFGTALTLVADIGELLRNDDFDGARIQELGEVLSHAIASIGQAFFNRTSFTGGLEMTEALTSGDAGKAERALMGLASSSVPGSGLLRNFRRADDKYLRETHDVVSAIMNTLPMFSDNLPPQRDLWGRPRTYETGLWAMYDAALPVQTKPIGGSVIDMEMRRLGMAVGMPQRSISIDKQVASLSNRPDIYSEFVRRAGEPAFAQLEAVVTGAHAHSAYYDGLSDGPDGEKAWYIRKVITAYRADAREEIIALYRSDLEQIATSRRVALEKARKADN